MPYFFGQNTDAILNESIDSIFGPNRTPTAGITDRPEDGDGVDGVGGGRSYGTCRHDGHS